MGLRPSQPPPGPAGGCACEPPRHRAPGRLATLICGWARLCRGGHGFCHAVMLSIFDVLLPSSSALTGVSRRARPSDMCLLLPDFRELFTVCAQGNTHGCTCETHLAMENNNSDLVTCASDGVRVCGINQEQHTQTAISAIRTPQCKARILRWRLSLQVNQPKTMLSPHQICLWYCGWTTSTLKPWETMVGWFINPGFLACRILPIHSIMNALIISLSLLSQFMSLLLINGPSALRHSTLKTLLTTGELRIERQPHLFKEKLASVLHGVPQLFLA